MYTAIMVAIEMEVEEWTLSFSRFNNMIPPSPDATAQAIAGVPGKNDRDRDEKVKDDKIQNKNPRICVL